MTGWLRVTPLQWQRHVSQAQQSQKQQPSCRSMNAWYFLDSAVCLRFLISPMLGAAGYHRLGAAEQRFSKHGSMSDRSFLDTTLCLSGSRAGSVLALGTPRRRCLRKDQRIVGLSLKTDCTRRRGRALYRGDDTTSGPQVLVHVSTYQGHPFWGYHIFDPGPCYQGSILGTHS